MKKLNLMLTALTALALISGCSKKQMQAETENRVAGLKDMNTNASLPSAPGDVVGKVTVGYQGWFSAAGDGSTVGWSHTNFETWPDVRQYSSAGLFSPVPFFQTGTQQPGFTGTLGNGSAAKTYSAYNLSVVDKHCEWMKQNGIDCIAVQRFASVTASTSPFYAYMNTVEYNVNQAANHHARKFYIMYDCGTGDSTKIKNDWTNMIVGTQHFTTSPAYARQNGKPVVCLFGVGFPARGVVSQWTPIINWFKAQGCYVIGSTPYNFTGDTANAAVYASCDMILPWAVGIGGTTNFQTYYAGGLAFCNSHGIDYQADTYPGTAFFNTSNDPVRKNQRPRTHGDFMWSQFVGARNAGVSSIYVSMFDEYNEATAIMNSAEDASMIPAGKYFLTLDAEGTHVTSDFYLRLVNDGSKLIKGLIPVTTPHPTPHIFTPPTGLTPSVLSSTSIKINWTAVTNCPCYNVKRSTVSGGPYTTVATGVTSATYTNTGLSSGTTYYYVITSGRVLASESVISAQTSATTP